MTTVYEKFPRKTERSYAVLKAMYEFGPHTYREMAQRFPSLSGSAFRMVVSHYALPLAPGSIYGNSRYQLTDYLKKWFAADEPATQDSGKAVKEIGQIVPPRTITKPKELKGYASGMLQNLREPIRDIGFITASQAATVYWNY